MNIDMDMCIEEFCRNREGDSARASRDLKPLVEDVHEYLRDAEILWPAAVPWRQREVCAREFTIVRAHICGIPAGPYGTAGHRDLARKAECLTAMERALFQEPPEYMPYAYIDVLLAYWPALATKQTTYRFLATFLEMLVKPKRE